MKGSIRIIAGLLVVFGAVGTLDYDPSASVLMQTLIAIVGLVILASGAAAANNHHE